MATKGAFRVECPHCGENFEADFWTVVRGDRDHDVKELILSGEFNLLMCTKCSEMFLHEEPFLYMDPTRAILAFVMPEAYLGEKDKWIAKLNADYEPLKDALSSEEGVGAEPAFLFGLAQLTDLLENDLNREEETDVMEFMAREDGYNLLPVKPAAAREFDLLFTVPMPAGLSGRAAALKAAQALSAKNDALPRLKKLICVLEALKSDELPFLKIK